MRGSPKRRRWYRVAVCTVLTSLLAYTSTRCVPIAAAGCPIIPRSLHASDGSHHEHLHEESSGEGAHHHGSHEVPEHERGSSGQHPRDHSCCEVTGKYAFTPGSATLSVAPVLFVVALLPAARAPGLIPITLVRRPPLPPSSSHPPPYIRFSALLV
jgi:hypothetical protein